MRSGWSLQSHRRHGYKVSVTGRATGRQLDEGEQEAIVAVIRKAENLEKAEEHRIR